MNTVICLLNTGTGLNLVEKTLIPPACHHRIHRGKMSNLQTIQQPLHMDSKILPHLHLRFGTLCVRVWFSIIRNIAVDMLLDTWFIDRIILGIFPSKWKVVPWHIHYVAILVSSKPLSNPTRLSPITTRLVVTQTRPITTSKKLQPNPLDTPSLVTTSHFVLCDVYHSSLRYSHRLA